MFTTTAEETAYEYIFTTTDGTQTWVRHWGKQPPGGQNLADYLQSCKTESERLSQLDLDQSAAPTPVSL